MTIALIVAAGRGERLGADRPKAMVELGGRPLVQWSIDALLQVTEIKQIVVALPGGVDAPAGTVGVQGGAVRSESVRRALDAAGPGETVLVHDAARPLLTAELARATLAALHADATLDAVIAAAPITDTIKRVTDGVVSQTLDRSSLWGAQTPQVFRRAALQRALNVSAQTLAQATDDAWLIERAGGRIALVEAHSENLKVTTVADLKLAELLLERRRPG
ncbi:MAG TPA: 2-C-methyl-D-erythritol 4-phosphate cytidylyltransferase [Solirubrobacteraceae bacterium]